MFSPAKSDLINEEPSVSDFQRSAKIVELHPSTPEKSIDISPDISPDITPEKETVAQFCQKHSITNDQFLALRRKASRRFPDTDFKPIREGSRTYWVQNGEILTQMIDEGAIDSKPVQSEIVESEIVEETELVNGSKLAIVKRLVSVDLALPDRQTITYETTDYSQIDALIDQLKNDSEAQKQVKEVLHLKQFSDDLIARKKKEQLVEMLIEQGYSQEDAIKIATGMNR